MVNPRFLLILGILNLPVYWCIWRALFGDWEDFKEAVYFWLTPRWLDWLRGELFEDTWANTKLLVFFVFCALFVASEYVMLLHHFPGIAGKASTAM